jgi:protein CpxP
MLPTSKKVSLFLSFIFVVFTVQAQPGPGREGRNMDPAQMATRQTDRMTEELELNDEQKEAIYDINLKYAEQIKAMREEMRSGGEEVDRYEIMGRMTDMRVEKAKEFKGVLTKQQYKTWKKAEIRRREEFQNRQGQGRPGGPPPRPGDE